MKVKTIFLWLFLMVLLSCGQRQAGNTMETENSIAFKISYPNGKAAAGVAYSLRPYWQMDQNMFINDLSMYQDGHTDSKGNLEIKHLPPGKYKLILSQDSLGLSFEIEHGDTTQSVVHKTELIPNGSIKGQVADASPDARVNLNGMAINASLDSAGAFLLENIPAGKHILSVFDAKSHEVFAEASCEVKAGKLLDLKSISVPKITEENADLWRFNQEVNLSKVIPDWMRPLSFPTVLKIYLNAQNFDFSQSLDQGQDLRLVSSATKELIYELNYFDKSQDFAVLKVRLESPADTNNILKLLWGKAYSSPLPPQDIWQGIDDSLQLALNSVLLDNFENDSDLNALQAPAQSGFWFTSSSHPEVNFMQPDPDEKFKSALKDASPRSGKALHLIYDIASPDWALVGSDFGENAYNLSTLDSLVFWVRGNTSFSVALESNDREPFGDKAWVHLTASEEWESISLKPTDFLAADDIGGNMGWDFVKSHLTNFSVFVNGEGELWLDDIRLYGVSIDDFSDSNDFNLFF